MTRLRRIWRKDHAPVPFFIGGEACEGREGDSVLTAILAVRPALRRSEFSGAPRAGFCLMGACQDCWVKLEDGTRLRACSTALTAGLRIAGEAVS